MEQGGLGQNWLNGRGDRPPQLPPQHLQAAPRPHGQPARPSPEGVRSERPLARDGADVGRRYKRHDPEPEEAEEEEEEGEVLSDPSDSECEEEEEEEE